MSRAKNKGMILISSVLIVAPMFFGLMICDRLPEEIPTHWGADGTVNGTSPRIFAVCVFPLIFLLIHWFCLFVTRADPKNRQQSRKVMGLVCWLVPAISLLVEGLIYSTALGMDIDIVTAVIAAVAVLFIILGNYLPKISQNATIGYRIPWTLSDEDNWFRTHRLGGKVCITGGFVMLVAAFLPESFLVPIFVIDVVLIGAVPTVYLYLYYRMPGKFRR